MKITVEITPKEIADLALTLQDLLGKRFSDAVTNTIIQKIRSEVHENNHHELEY